MAGETLTVLNGQLSLVCEKTKKNFLYIFNNFDHYT